MTSSQRALFACAVLFFGGCYGTHGAPDASTTSDTSTPPVADSGTGPTPVPVADAAPIPPPPAPPPTDVPPLVRGSMTDSECALRWGRTGFVLVPDGEPRVADLCVGGDEPETFLAIDAPRLPENSGTLEVGPEGEVAATLCHLGECMGAERGTLEIFIARGEVATVNYDLRFADGTGLSNVAEVTSFCGEHCPLVEQRTGRGRATCGPDDGPAWTIVLGTVPDMCGGMLEDGVRINIFARGDRIRWGSRFILPSDDATAVECSGGHCTEALEGVVRIDHFDPGVFVAGEYVFFAAPGTDYEGRFFVSDFCEGDVLCG